MGASIDRLLEGTMRGLTPVLRPLLPLLQHRPIYAGLLIGLPFFLFISLASSTSFHWWHLPWSDRVTVWLLWLMALGAGGDLLLYGTLSLLFFLAWWRKKLPIAEHKRPRMALSYALTPLFYGLILGWGVTSLRRQKEDIFAYAAISALVLMGFGLTRLRMVERANPEQRAT